MAVKTVKSELQVTKEFREIVDFLSAVLRDVKAGKDVAEIAAAQFPALFKAVEGFDELSEEIHSEYLSDNAAYLVKAIMDELRNKKTVPPSENKGGVIVKKKTAKVAKKATKKAARSAKKTTKRTRR